MDIAELGYRIDSADVDRGTAALKRHAAEAKRNETATQRMERQYARTIKQAKALGVALGAVGLALAYGVIRNTIEAEKVQAQLEAALKSTGGAAGQTVKMLNEHAAALQAVTTYGDEATNSAQAILLTFTRIQGDTFPKATEAVLDMATALQMDLKSSAIQVGKALNDPILGVTALGRAGVQFSEDQKKMIKALVETGRTAEAQVIVLRELETQFGGSARAARDTLGGALEALKNAFGDLLEGDTGSEGVIGTRKAIEDLTAVLQSEGVKQGFGSIINGAATATAKLAELLAGAANLTRFMAEEFAARVGGPNAQDTTRVEDRIKRLKTTMDAVRDAGILDPFAIMNASELIPEDLISRRETILERLQRELDKEQLKLRVGIELNDEAAMARLGLADAETGKPAAGGGLPVITPKGDKATKKIDREALKLERERAEALRLSQEAQADLLRITEDMRAELGGPFAQVQLDYIRREDELIGLAKLAGLSQEELATSLGLLEQARLRDVAAIEAQIEAEKKRAKEMAEADQVNRMDGLREDTASFFVDLVKNGEDAVDRLAEYLYTSALQGIGKMIAEQMFGAFGTTGGGMFGGSGGGGDWISAIASLFGGGRALGGYMPGNKLHEVGERNRPELAQIGGRQYLIPGNQGRVEPVGGTQQRMDRRPIQRGGDTFIIQGATSKRSIRAIQIERDRQQRKAVREYA